MLLLFPNDGRKLKKCITALLKANLATKITRLNYVQQYYLNENSIQKEEKKLLHIQTTNPEKIEQFLQKQFPDIEQFPLSN